MLRVALAGGLEEVVDRAARLNRVVRVVGASDKGDSLPLCAIMMWLLKNEVICMWQCHGKKFDLRRSVASRIATKYTPIMIRYSLQNRATKTPYLDRPTNS